MLRQVGLALAWNQLLQAVTLHHVQRGVHQVVVFHAFGVRIRMQRGDETAVVDLDEIGILRMVVGMDEQCCVGAALASCASRMRRRSTSR